MECQKWRKKIREEAEMVEEASYGEKDLLTILCPFGEKEDEAINRQASIQQEFTSWLESLLKKQISRNSWYGFSIDS